LQNGNILNTVKHRYNELVRGELNVFFYFIQQLTKKDINPLKKYIEKKIILAFFKQLIQIYRKGFKKYDEI